MLIAYFDEVKYQEGVQPYEWLAGIVVDATAVRELEEQVGALAVTAFGSSELCKATEFHASEIMAGKRNCKGKSLVERLEILRALAGILADRDRVMRVHARIDVKKLYSDKDPSELAFIFFVERVNVLARRKQDIGLLIGDFEHERVVSDITQKLSRYRASGTPYEFGQEIDAIIDTVHFSRSHHSRMLQLADVFAWFTQLPHGPSAGKEPQHSLIQFLRNEADILWPTTYKEWPSES